MSSAARQMIRWQAATWAKKHGWRKPRANHAARQESLKGFFGRLRVTPTPLLWGKAVPVNVAKPVAAEKMADSPFAGVTQEIGQKKEASRLARLLFRLGLRRERPC